MHVAKFLHCCWKVKVCCTLTKCRLLRQNTFHFVNADLSFQTANFNALKNYLEFSRSFTVPVFAGFWRLGSKSLVSILVPRSLFSASLGRWKKDPGCGWSRDHPESGWQKNLLGGRGDRVFCLLMWQTL